MELSCAAQMYDWGKLGSSSLVARLLASNNNTEIDEKLPYAELWMGTHPSGESYIQSTGQTLHHYMKENPACTGTVVEGDLPFLFKVLSIRKALSIQAHPDKELAVMLNQQQPALYRDANHKPELAIAVTPFEVLCGFRPLEEIKNFLKIVPELQEIIPSTVYHTFMKNASKSNLEGLFTVIMSSSESVVKSTLTNLINRLKSSVEEIKTSQLFYLVETLSEQHSLDVGIFAVYFMNYFKLKPGEAVFINANIPHAYLSGDCIEAMACSDNVVRAGLTPKFRDVDTLCSMLNYESSTISEMTFLGKNIDQFCTVYKPPVKEFAVIRASVPPSKEHVVTSHHSCSLIIIVEGTGKCPDLNIRPGAVIFLPARSELKILVTTHLLLFQAFCNV